VALTAALKKTTNTQGTKHKKAYLNKAIPVYNVCDYQNQHY